MTTHADDRRRRRTPTGARGDRGDFSTDTDRPSGAAQRDARKRRDGPSATQTERARRVLSFAVELEADAGRNRRTKEGIDERTVC